jgi:DNA-binding CsgD family transcriptional regulator
MVLSGLWSIRMNESGQSVATLPAGAEGSAEPEACRRAQSDTSPAGSILAALTDKQRAVLDLLIQHKTSKEISRLLGISHHTVDQRIMLARAKLGVASRGEVAQAYRRLLAETAAEASIYERSVYDFSDVAVPLDVPQDMSREDKADWLQPRPTRRGALPRAAFYDGEALAEPYHHVLPEMFDGPYGTYIRLGTIAVFAMFLILIVMGGLAMFAQLSQIIAH